MKLLLQDQADQRVVESPWSCRPVTNSDIPALAQLILDAYAGTIDDEGETLDEALQAIQDTFADAPTTGKLLPMCSFVIEEGGRALACTLVTLWRAQPLLAYVMTHPAAQGRGMARFLIRKSIEALLAHDYHELTLFVTKGNSPAEHLYATLGFEPQWTLGSAALNGTRIYYEVAGEEMAGDGSTPLVLLHADLTTSAMWDAQWGPLASAHRTIRYDLRGCGWSRRPPGPFSPQEDLAQLLDFLGVERAVLIGAAIGGQVAIDFTLEHPERVAALILVGARVSGVELSVPTRERCEEIEVLAARGEIDRAVELALRLWVEGERRSGAEGGEGDDGAEGDPTVRERVREMMTRNVARAAELGQSQPLPLEPPARARLGEVQAPTLVVVGERDLPETLATAELLARNIPGAQKVVMQDAGHLASMEQSERFTRLVVAFMRRHGLSQLSSPDGRL
jgi:pimeloyl-ACP methyl ester carboxylesterase/GNAT superfamily N-acetyltransferase